MQNVLQIIIDFIMLKIFTNFFPFKALNNLNLNLKSVEKNLN